jgi:oxygen-independent coproporphyrinogen-3 oxidase
MGQSAAEPSSFELLLISIVDARAGETSQAGAWENDSMGNAPAAAGTLGIYISIPFCRAKCSYCNFASGVFAESRMQAYVDRLCAEIAAAPVQARELQAELPADVGSIYFGGGTPTLLAPQQLEQIFAAIRGQFAVQPGAEITVECAPGQLADGVLEELRRQGTNRISFGVQSFVDAEAATVGRTHTAAIALAEIERVRSAGIAAVNVDLIAGLPHQTEASWRHSLETAVGSGAGHVSVYMLEVDEDSRLGREVLAGGVRYHAHFVPDDERTADLYLAACEYLDAAGVRQYEISNFARDGAESQHNLRYWLRQPYIGFGLDAHSMLRRNDAVTPAVRFANTDDLDRYIGGEGALALLAETRKPEMIARHAAMEETIFLGLRLNAGLDMQRLQAEFPAEMRSGFATLDEQANELAAEGLLLREGTVLKLSSRGRLLSNEVFERLLDAVPVAG